MIPAVVLAAGASSRMGRLKALLPAGRAGETFVGRLVRTFSEAGVDDIIVVVGAQAAAVRDAVAGLPTFARIVENRQYERGQLSSLVAALDVVDRPGVRALLSMPVDMPLVTPATVRAVVAAYEATRRLIVRPVLTDAAGSGLSRIEPPRHGHPVLFDRSLFDELRAADLSRGARAIIAAHASDVLDVPVTDAGAVQDVDTPEDYARYIGLRLEEPR